MQFRRLSQAPGLFDRSSWTVTVWWPQRILLIRCRSRVWIIPTWQWRNTSRVSRLNPGNVGFPTFSQRRGRRHQSEKAFKNIMFLITNNIIIKYKFTAKHILRGYHDNHFYKTKHFYGSIETIWFVFPSFSFM